MMPCLQIHSRCFNSSFILTPLQTAAGWSTQPDGNIECVDSKLPPPQKKTNKNKTTRKEILFLNFGKN